MDGGSIKLLLRAGLSYLATVAVGHLFIKKKQLQLMLGMRKV